MIYIFLSIVSFSACILIITQKDRVSILLASRNDAGAKQSAHSGFVPRIGGLAIFLAFVSLYPFADQFGIDTQGGKFFISILPIVVVGLAEDIGLGMSPLRRLLAITSSGLLTSFFFNISLSGFGIPGLDALMTYTPIAVAITVFMAAGVTNAFNLIDGINGLCSFVTISTGLALMFLAQSAGLSQIATILGVIVAVTFGFFLANYPFGRIFLGDAGAYMLGHALCWVAIAMVALRADISPFAVLLVFFWPVADTLLAIWRRRTSGVKTDQPDRLHFHQLVMRFLEIRFLGRHKRHISNPLTTIVLAPMIVAPQIAGVLLAFDHQKAIIATVLFVVLFFSSYLMGISLARNYSRKVRVPKTISVNARVPAE